MEEEQPKLDPDTDTLLSLSSQLLGFRDFSGARKYALLAQQSDPDRREPSQIIAIVDVILAAQPPVGGGTPDWASVLQLQNPAAADSSACIRSQFTKLAGLLHPCKNRFHFCQEAFDHVCSAWSAMKSRSRGDESRGNGGEKEESNAGNSNSSSGTFWTVCPYCFCAHEYVIEYEDCGLRCQNCRKAFHGLAAPLPPPVGEGRRSDEYLCGYGCFPLKYCFDEKIDEKKREAGNGVRGNPADQVHVMEISDDSEEDKEEEKSEVRNGGKKKGKRMKAIPKLSTKVTGTCKSYRTRSVQQLRKKTFGEEDACDKSGNASPVGGGIAAENLSGEQTDIGDSTESEVGNGGKKDKRMKAIPKHSTKVTGTGKSYRMRRVQQLRKKGFGEEIGQEDAYAKSGNTSTAVGRIGAENLSAEQTEIRDSTDSELEFLWKEDDVYVSLKDLE